MLTIRVAVSLSLFSGALAGPACSRKHWGTSDCIQLCKTRWGWSGSVMGSDPWGSVMSSSSGSYESTVSEACGSDTVVSSAEGAVGTWTSSAISETTPSSTEAVPSSSFSSSILVESSSTSEPSSSPAAFIPVISSTTSTSEFTSFTPETSSSFFEPASTTSEPPATTEVPETTEQAPATTTEAPTTTSSSEAAPPASSSDSSSSNSGSTSQSDIDAYLKATMTDLTWSDDLAAAAQQWANNCKFEHSGEKLVHMERIWRRAWTDEGYDGAGTLNHFTQVVWKATTQVGCAVASCDGIFDASFGKANFYVCEYSPAGNVIGQIDANVQA
ncbi:PR-1-like protein [Hymenopellis radicata]|nr:PR-1-like protein [Hymenopellis radicata]